MFLLLFCTLDELYQELVPAAISSRSQYRRIKFSDSEVLTLSQEALSMDSKRSFHRYVQKNYLHLFPRLLSRDRHPVAHLGIRSQGREPLPITDTGYRSHFIPAHQVERAGDPAAYVLAWLDDALEGLSIQKGQHP